METISVQRISPGAFAAYGRVAQAPTGPPAAKGPAFAYWSDLAAYTVGGETEIGLCTVSGDPAGAVTWMERHMQTPEVLIPVDAPFVLPVMAPDGRVEAFEVRPGEAVVIGPGVWHSAGRATGRSKATYFVLFRRGTPQEDVTKQSVPDVLIDR